MIGKIRFLVCLCCVGIGTCVSCVAVLESVSLATVSCDDHQSIDHIQVGVPVCLQVTCAGSESIDDALMQNLVIPGMDRVSVRGVTTQSSVRMVHNGSQSQSYYEKHRLYTFVCDAEGDYTFGPVAIKNDDGSSIVSHACTIRVLSREQEAQLVQKEDTSGAQFSLHVENKRPFCGQKVPYKIIVELPLEHDCSITHDMVLEGEYMHTYARKAYKRRAHKNRKSYGVYIWEGDVVFERAGDYTLGPLECLYSCAQHNSMFPAFMHLSLSRSKKRGYTNAEKIFVEPLPKAPQGFIGLVGKDVTLRMYKDEASLASLKQYGAFSCSLEFVGDADFAHFSPINLQLPSFCKQYDAASATEDAKKVYHYTVQINQAGTVHIPEQKFVYFDTQRGAYTELTTEPFDLFVQEAPAPETSKVVVVPAQVTEDVQDKSESSHESTDIVMSASCLRLWSMPVWLFLVCIFALPVLLLLKVLGEVFLRRWRYVVFVTAQKKKLRALKKECFQEKESGEKLALFLSEYQRELQRLSVLYCKGKEWQMPDFTVLHKLLEPYCYADSLCSSQEFDYCVAELEQALFSRASLKYVRTLFFFFVIACCFGRGICAQDTQEAVKNIAQRITTRWHASYAGYYKCQEQLALCGVPTVDDTPMAFRVCIWLMPWIFWQLVFVALCSVFCVRPRWFLLVLILCCGIVVGYGFVSRRAQRICVCSDHVVVLTGPACTYKKHSQLARYSQGYEKRSVCDELGNRWILVECADVLGWVQAQDVYRYTIASLARDL